jgi:hypothetical protein
MRTSTFGGLLLVGLAGAILFAMPVMTARGRVGQAATPAEFVGCWRFNNGQLVRVVKDGTLSMGQLKGKWRLADPDKRVYVINWPEILDNAVLSADEKTLTETNPWFTLNATRMSGGTGIVGLWQWPGTLVLTVRADNTFSLGPVTGKWKPGELGERTYTLIWPPPIHTGILAPDGQKIAGADQYGTQFAGGKETCGDARVRFSPRAGRQSDRRWRPEAQEAGSRARPQRPASPRRRPATTDRRA